MWSRRRTKVSGLYRGGTRLHNPISIRDLRHNFRGAYVTNRPVTLCSSVELNRYYDTKHKLKHTRTTKKDTINGKAEKKYFYIESKISNFAFEDNVIQQRETVVLESMPFQALSCKAAR